MEGEENEIKQWHNMIIPEDANGEVKGSQADEKDPT